MTAKEQLIQAIEHTPESIILRLLEFLEFLNTRYPQIQPASPQLKPIPAQDLSFRDLSGILHKTNRPTVSLEAMEQAILQGALDSQ